MGYGGLFTGENASASDRIALQMLAFREEHGRVPRAMLCANHGVFVVAKRMREAWSDLYYLERLCELQVRALSCAGGDISKLQMIDSQTLDESSEQYEGE